MNVLYHTDKANIAAGSLSILSMGSVAHVEDERNELEKDIHRLTGLRVCLMNLSYHGVIVQNRSESSLVAEFKEKTRQSSYIASIEGCSSSSQCCGFLPKGRWCTSLTRSFMCS